MPVLEAVELTLVRYTKGDHLGYMLAWISLIPVFISLGVFPSHFIFRRELHGIFFYLGHIISLYLSIFIKNFVKQPRPETCVMLEICHSNGWPSNHAEYTFFFATYLSLLNYKGINGICNGKLGILMAWCLGFLTMYSRVYLGYHTVEQVKAGAIFGTIIAGVWFWVVNSFISHYYPAIEKSRIGKMLYLKDTSHLPNVLKFEYETAIAARQTMMNCKGH
ncbi:lipid phosphate phosphatase gamma, chloroplastic-like [Quillaja saponaria]|uniref:Lipid phosphate phosphatase gamma, chloroplastic-like n=1 Tax=Quillaja saponaria TaxID=32244 RepID=A0AAD7Q8V2_QUISA|nr:lipid phosphate phosphatase gamma, chloroplastic-like [Quillaja saponaria]